MHKILSVTVTAVACSVLAGCAAGSGGGAAGAETYRENLGQASPNDFSRFTRQILDRYHFEIERVDSSASMHVFRTRWRNRYPFDDEIALGAVDARSRLVIQARTRGGAGTTGASNLRTVEFTAENELLIEAVNTWRRDLLTDMFEDYVREIARTLKTEFQGVRVY